jgi:hypothetical protein
LPDKCKGEMRENFYWISDETLILERFLSMSGFPYSDYFEVAVIYRLKQKGKNT